MAKDDVFFKKLAEVHPKFHTPAAAIISLGVLAVVLTQAGKFSELIEGVIFVGWIFYGLAGAAIFPLRRKYAGRALPYRVPGYPWTPALFVLAAAAIIGNSIYRATIDPTQFRHVLAALGLLAAGVPVYFFWRFRKKAG
jgi:APA family basic amino acid/polyamine antiporter